MISRIDLSQILDRHAYNNSSPNDYLLKKIDNQSSISVPHGNQVIIVYKSYLSMNFIF